MRELSNISLTKIAQRFGSEPFLCLGINWAGTVFYYADKSLHINVPGKLLQINGLENVTTLAGSTNATNLNILLDDTDGSLKNIFNVLDIHKRPVSIYQCFEGIDFADKFVIFEGLIESPIVYSDGDRTLSFSVVGMNENREIGFSPEEGQFPNLPTSLVGQPWPMAFGYARHCPGLTYQYPAVGTILYPYFVVDPKLDVFSSADDPNSPENAGTAGSTTVTGVAVPRKSYGQKGELVNTPIFHTVDEILAYTQNMGNNAIAGQQSGGVDYSDSGGGSGSVAEALRLSDEQLSEALDQRPPAGKYFFIVEGQEYDEHDYELQINSTTTPGTPAKDPSLRQPQSNESAYAKVAEVEEELKAKKASSTGVQLINKGVGFPIDTKLIISMNNHVFQGQMDESGYMTLKQLRLPEPVPAYHQKKGFERNPVTNLNTTPGVDTSYEQNAKYLTPAEENTTYFVPDGTLTPEEYGLKRYKPRFTSLGEASVGWKVQQGLTSDGFQIYEAGSQLRILGDASVDYIVNIFPTEVHTVWGYKSVGNVKTLTQLHPDRWEQVTVDFNGVQAYVVRLNRLLSYYPREDWSDGIYVDQTSVVGPNPAHIMIHMINLYTTDLTYDQDSFALAATQLANYPMNFTISDKSDILAFLQDLAYQCRCAIYIKDRVFYIKYLAITPEPDDTITIDDVLEGTIQVSTTTTEEIVTRMTGKYSDDYAKGTESSVIARNNVAKYGLFKDEHNYFAYTHAQYVQKSVTYWLLQRSNCWKKLKFSTPIHKLNLETFDTINFIVPGQVSNGPVLCRIESTQYNSDLNQIDFDVWVPVRLGEMDPYKFAFPADSTLQFSDIYLQEFQNPTFGDFRNQAKGIVATVQGQASNSSSSGGADSRIGNGFGVSYSNDIGQFPADERRDTGDRYPTDIDDHIVTPRGAFEPFLKPLELPETENDRVARTAEIVARRKPLQLLPTNSSCIPGKVGGKAGGGNNYSVAIYPNGLNEAAENVIVTQLQIREDEEIPSDTWVLVSRVFKDKSGDEQRITATYDYYMQVPVWIGQMEE